MGITITTGVICGRLSQRWGPVPDLLAAADHLAGFPTQIGNWQLLGEEVIPDPILQVLSCAGYVNRHYVNRKSGQTVDLAITVGPGGPISVHTPEICYSSRAYSVTEPRRRWQLTDGEGRTHSFWNTAFRSTNANAERLRVYYGWCADGEWTASDSPRFEFAGRRLLFKLQMASRVSPVGTTNTNDPCQEFLADFLRCGWKVSG
jgi:hypothetical protein